MVSQKDNAELARTRNEEGGRRGTEQQEAVLIKAKCVSLSMGKKNSLAKRILATSPSFPLQVCPQPPIIPLHNLPAGAAWGCFIFPLEAMRYVLLLHSGGKFPKVLVSSPSPCSQT